MNVNSVKQDSSTACTVIFISRPYPAIPLHTWLTFRIFNRGVCLFFPLPPPCVIRLPPSRSPSPCPNLHKPCPTPEQSLHPTHVAPATRLSNHTIMHNPCCFMPGYLCSSDLCVAGFEFFSMVCSRSLQVYLVYLRKKSVCFPFLRFR